VFGGTELRRLNEEAQWLCREIGRLRDLDVVANDIVGREATTHCGELGLADLAEAFRREATLTRTVVCGSLGTARVHKFLLDLGRLVETRGWLDPQDVGQTERLATPMTELVAKALRKRWKKIVSYARDLATLDIEKRHELRKELKKLRYAAEFFASVLPDKEAAPFLRRLKSLQTVFGDLNDAAVVQKLLSRPEFCANGNGGQRAIGWMLGATTARADASWNQAHRLWRKLEKSRRPFR
jgi:CHAD domain-containing protein